MDDRLDPASESGHAAAERPLSYLFVCDEWSTNKGGISAVNRKLALATAKQGHVSMCLVTTTTDAERRDAAQNGVQLFQAERTPAGPDLHLPVTDVLERIPDVAVGHDRISGHIAWLYARKYANSKLVHIVHTAPAEVEPYKNRPDAAMRIEAREAFTRELAGDADVIAAIGPRLTRYVTSLLEDGYGGAPVLRIDPQLDLDSNAMERRRQVPARRNVMVLGRTGDIALKGLDIASRAVAALTPRSGQLLPILYVRGAPVAMCEEVRRTLVEKSGLARGRVDVRPFVSDPSAVRFDLRRATLCVMPSRAEGFGLVAWEAIAVGTPLLVSSQSGAAELLREQLGATAEKMIVDVADDLTRDVQAWAEAIQRMLDDLPAAFAYAHEIRSALAGRLTWASAVEMLQDRLRGSRSPELSVNGGG
jgi:glycosyltransferase involved in cell wall biosynthesis